MNHPTCRLFVLSLLLGASAQAVTTKNGASKKTTVKKAVLGSLAAAKKEAQLRKAYKRQKRELINAMCGFINLDEPTPDEIKTAVAWSVVLLRSFSHLIKSDHHDSTTASFLADLLLAHDKLAYEDETVELYNSINLTGVRKAIKGSVWYEHFFADEMYQQVFTTFDKETAERLFGNLSLY